MLEMKASCEKCLTELPAESTRARICSFECTWCVGCATEMSNRCPNCGGELVDRPRRG